MGLAARRDAEPPVTRRRLADRGLPAACGLATFERRPDRFPGVKGTASRRPSAGPDGLPVDTRDPAWLRRTQPLRGACSGPRLGLVWSLLRAGHRIEPSALLRERQ